MFRTKDTPQNLIPKRVTDALKANFSDQELVQLGRFATPVEVAAGTNLTLEGTLGQQALVMVEGSASVIRNGERVGTINAGEIIGEIALLTGELRMATVVTDVDSTVYAMSPRDFASLLALCPRLEKRVSTTAVRRMAKA